MLMGIFFPTRDSLENIEFITYFYFVFTYFSPFKTTDYIN